MSIDDPQSEPSPPSPRKQTPVRPWFGRRKRVIAKEVGTHLGYVGEEAAEMRAPAEGSRPPGDVIDIPGGVSAPAGESMIDPTLFSERHRRPGQNAAYHVTQGLITVAIFTASAGIVGTLMDHRLRALIIAGTGAVCSGVAVGFVKRSRLAYRLRGYVAAACVLSLLSMAACFFMPNFLHGGSSDEEAGHPPTTNVRP